MDSQHSEVNPQQEIRRLRARAEMMRSRQRIAVGGVAAGAMIAAARHQLAAIVPAPLGLAMIVGAVVVPLVAAVPFLRSVCPKCKQRYHSAGSIFRHPNNPAACKGCGFNIDKHIPRY